MATAKKANTVKKAAAKKTTTKKAAAKKTARSVPEESPQKGMAVDQWIAQHTSGWQTDVVKRLVAIIQGAAPDAISSIKWGQPVFESNGPFAYFRPAKAHVTFGFWRGAEMADPKGLLSGTGDRMMHMKIAGVDQVDGAAITAMVRDAVRLNRENGNPATRAKK